MSCPPAENWPVHALIFDMDGLLIDSEPVWFEIEGAALARHGFEWTRQEAEACKGQGTPNTVQYWNERHGLNLDIDEETRFIIGKMMDLAGQIPFRPGAVEILETGRSLGLGMALASSSPFELIEQVVEKKKLGAYFDVLVSGRDVGRGKPAPDVFLEAARRLGVEPEHAIVLEDSVAGCQAGIAACARVMAVPSDPEHWGQCEASWVVRDLYEAKSIVEKLCS